MDETANLIQIAREEFRSTDCFCGGKKASGQSFCRKCYWELPATMRKNLYFRFGHRYEQHYHAAKKWLRENSNRITVRGLEA